MCYTGSQANVSVYSQEHHHAAKWRSLLQPLQDRKKGRKAWSWRACCAGRLGHILHALHQPWEGGSGMLRLNAWEEPLPQSGPPVPPAPGRRCRREGPCQPALRIFSRLNLSVGKPGVIPARLWGRTALATALRAELSQPSWWGYRRPRERRKKRRNI